MSYKTQLNGDFHGFSHFYCVLEAERSSKWCDMPLYLNAPGLQTSLENRLFRSITGGPQFYGFSGLMTSWCDFHEFSHLSCVLEAERSSKWCDMPLYLNAPGFQTSLENRRLRSGTAGPQFYGFSDLMTL